MNDEPKPSADRRFRLVNIEMILKLEYPEGHELLGAEFARTLHARPSLPYTSCFFLLCSSSPKQQSQRLLLKKDGEACRMRRIVLLPESESENSASAAASVVAKWFWGLKHREFLSESQEGVDGEAERIINWTNSPKEEEIEKYVRYTFATDTPDGCIGADWNGWYSKGALAYFSGGGAKRFDALTPTESRAATMESSGGVVGGYPKRFMIRNLGLEEHRLRSQQEFLEKEELANRRGVRDFLSGYPSWEQNDAAVQSESEGSYEAGSSPIFDESLYTSQLEAELRETSDAIEEMEGKVAIRLMVAEAVLRGIARAVEVDALEAVEISEAELLKVKQELQEKDSAVVELINTLKKKEEELLKLVDESRHKERRLVMDMLEERERILGKIQESEKYVAQKEKELLKMAEHMVELSLNLAAETKRVNVLEKQIRESKEAESRKGKELLAMMEKAEQFRSEKEFTVEMVRREARLKELRLAESLAAKEQAFTNQLEKIRTLETAQQQLIEELDLCKEKELRVKETLAEKEKVVSQQQEAISGLEATEQKLREEMDLRRQKEVELSVTLCEKDDLLEKQLRMITALETAEQNLKKDADVRSKKEVEMIEALTEKEEKDKSSRLLQDEIQLLKSKIGEMSSILASLTDETVSYKAELENLRLQLATKEGVLRASESRCEELVLRERRLLDEIASMNEKVLACEDAAQLAQDQLNEQTWRHETEVALIVTTLEGRVAELFLRGKDWQEEIASLRNKVVVYEDAAKLAENRLQEQTWKHQIETDFVVTILEGGVSDLERDINLLGEESAGNQTETDTFRSKALQSRSLEMNNLRRSKLSLEDKLSDAHAAAEILENTVKRHKEEVDKRDLLLEQANRRIAQLEEKLIKSDGLFQDTQREVFEMKVREEHLKKQQQALEGEVEQGKQSLERFDLRELELRQTASQLQTLVEESEEKALRFELENLVTSSYLESSVQDIQKLVTEVNEQSTLSSKRMAFLNSELEATGNELSKTKTEVDRLKSELSACVGRIQSILWCSSDGLAEARTALQAESVNSERLEGLVSELQNRLEMLRNESQAALSRKEEVAEMALRFEEANWRSEVETIIVMNLAEGSAKSLLDALAQSREQMKMKDEHIGVLRREHEEMSKKLEAYGSENSALKISLANKTRELGAFRTDFVLQKAMQRDALSKAQAHAKDAEKKIEELKRLKSTLLGRIQEEKQRWVQVEEALAEEKWKRQFEMDVISTVTSEAIIFKASRNAELDTGVRRPSHEDRRGGETKKARTSSHTSSETDQSSRLTKGNPARADTEVSANKAPLSKLDLLLRENDELHIYIREKEQLLSQKTEEVFKLKREFYKELEKIKVERKRGYESDSSQESPRTKVTSKLRHQAVTGQEVKQNGNHAKLESAVADEEKRLSEATALWDAEKSSLQGSLSQREEQIKELLSRLSWEKEAHLKDTLKKLEMAHTEHERKMSEIRAQWEAEKSTLLKSLMQKEDEIRKLQSRDQLNDDIAKLGKIVAKIEEVAIDQGRKEGEMRALWDGEKSALQESLSEMRSSWDAAKTTLLESLFEIRFSWDAEKFTLEELLSDRDDKIEVLLTKLATREKEFSAKLEEVEAEDDRKVSAMRAVWDAEKSALQESLSEMRASWDAQKTAFVESLSDREKEIKELLTKLSSQGEGQTKEVSAELEEVTAEHERKVSEMRAVWNAEKLALEDSLSEMRSSWDAQKSTFLESIFEMRFSCDAEKFILQELLCEKDDEIKELSVKLSTQSEAQQNEVHAKVEEVVAEHDRKVSDMRAVWDTEKCILQVSLSERDDKIKELSRKLSMQSEAHNREASAKLEEVVAENERKVSEMRALWDAEKAAVEEHIKELVAELKQVSEKEREALARQASLELSARQKERCRLEVLHEEEMERSAAVYRSELDVKTRKLIEAVKDAEERSKQVRQLKEEVRQVKDEASALRTELSSVRKQMQIEFARVVEALIASLQQLEKSVAQQTKQYNLRLHRAQSLLNHLVTQCKLLASKEAEHMQNLQNLQKAEAEVDLLGDEVDALVGVLEKVYTVVSLYHPVIQHYPGLADLEKAVRNELLQRLRDPVDVSL
ncbi:hypothetical protein R1flu_010895 [Riccia fluitans]|uniref:Uncharacterized protein n=1 Tax=Riccia fluitans TaxID=41844 RepID=A0ABD1Z771_9MARC